MSALAARMREPRVRLVDNPVRRAQARRRLRRRQAAPVLVVVALLALVALGFGGALEAQGSSPWPVVRGALLFAAGVLLFVAGTARVAGVVLEERAIGLLDLHRATPTTPLSDALGYLLGPPAREHAGALLLVPAIVIATLRAREPLAPTLAGLGVLALCAWTYHAVALFTALASGSRRLPQSLSAALVVLVFCAVPLLEVGLVAVAHLTPLPALAALGLLGDAHGLHLDVDVLGVAVPPLVFTALVQAILLAFLMAAAARKLARAEAHALSRAATLALVAIGTLLLVAPAWSRLATSRAAGAGIAALCACILVGACAACALLAPTRLERVRALVRARRGDGAPRWREDGASVWPLVPAFGALLALALALLSRALPDGGMHALFSPTTALALFAALAFLALVAGAAEALRLEPPGALRSRALSCAFALLVLPWVVGLALRASFGGAVASCACALSPLYAVGRALYDLGVEWSGRSSGAGFDPRLWLALGATVLAAVAFHTRAARTRDTIARGVALGPVAGRTDERD